MLEYVVFYKNLIVAVIFIFLTSFLNFIFLQSFILRKRNLDYNSIFTSGVNSKKAKDIRDLLLSIVCFSMILFILFEIGVIVIQSLEML